MRSIIILIGILLPAAWALFAGENLILNGDMTDADPDTDYPRHWSVDKKSKCGLDRAVTPEKGINSLRIEGGMCTTMVKVTGGHVYKCSYLLKTEGFQWRTAASFQILWYKDGKPMFKGKSWNMKVKNIQGGHNWTKVEVPNCVAPEGATAARIRLLQAFEPSGRCWFAKLRMEEEIQGDAFQNRVTELPQIGGMTMEKAWDEKNWEDAAQLTDFLKPHTGMRSDNPTDARILYDKDAIWIYARCEQKGVGDAEKRDRTFSTEDAVEFFLLPPNREYQFHVMMLRTGKLFTCTEKWNDGNWPMKLHPWPENGIEYKMKVEKDQWIAIARIPFKGLGVPVPAAGTEWRGNVCRSVYSGEQESSAWSFLKEAHFQYSEHFGKFIFSDRIQKIRNISISNEGAGAELTNTSDKPVQFNIALIRPAAGNGFITAEKTLSVAPGKTQVAELLSPTEDALMRYVEIRADGKLIRKHCGMPVNEYLAMTVYDPENVRTQTMYLASDTPFFMALNMRHSFPVVKKGRTHNLIMRFERPFDLYMELPPEITLNGFTFADNWLKPGLVKPASCTPIERDGVRLKQWKFEMPFIVQWNDNAFVFFYECKAAPDQDLTGSYYFMHDGKTMQRHEMKFHTMNVGKVKRSFKKFLADPGLLGIQTLSWWLPKDTVRRFKSFGFNWVGIEVEKMRNREFYTGTEPKTKEDYYDLLFQDMKRTGEKLYFKTFITSSGPNSWTWPGQDPESKAVDWSGKNLVNQYNYPALCPSYRGKCYQNWVQKLINSSAFAKYRITWLGLDLELWPPNVWPKVCFCPRCLDLFKQYCRDHGHPDYADKDPKTIVSAQQNKDFIAFWERFKQYQRSVFISDCVKQVRASVKGEASTSPWDRFITSDWTSPGNLDEGTLDLYEVPLYNSPDNNYLKLKRLMEKCGFRKDVICSTTFGQTGGCPDFHVREEHIMDNVNECAAFGMQGIAWYYVTSMDARRLKVVVDSLNVLLPLESLILDGRMGGGIRCDNPGIALTRLVAGPESLIGVRTYGASQDITAKYRFDDLKSPVSIYECETGRKIASVTPEQPEFTYTAKKNTCRLLYAGTDDLWKERCK